MQKNPENSRGQILSKGPKGHFIFGPFWPSFPIFLGAKFYSKIDFGQFFLFIGLRQCQISEETNEQSLRKSCDKHMDDQA